MSNNGDLKKEGPPTLFNSQSETDEAGHTRILASLEGRVGAGGNPPKSLGRRYGIAAVIAVLLAGVGAWIVLNPSGDQSAPQVAEHAAPATPAATQQAAAEPAQATAPGAPASESAAAPAATIVNVTPNDEHALDKPGKDEQTAKATADAPAKDAHTSTTVQQAVTAKSGDTPQAKVETAKLVAKSTNTPVKVAQVTKAKPQAATKAKNRKGGLAPDDPDADLLAALLAPQNANQPANQPSYKGK
ncbi:hypothetical protein [Ralstonia sp. 24A2]|uniref:hypothetical protein n=1 Tax=Ralstonia sp. 24A2 TaxID=3447364 RepID=UPI003F6A0018